MKAISIYQPWAQLIAHGIKTIETRSHDRYKCLIGQRIAIHASKKNEKLWLYFLRNNYHVEYTWCKEHSELIDNNMGKILCVATVLKGRWLGNNDSNAALLDIEFGGKIKKYGLFLINIVRLKEPLTYIGKQGIFNINIPELDLL